MSEWKKLIYEVNGSPSNNILLFLKKIFLYSSSGILFRIRKMQIHKKKNQLWLMLWHKKRIENKYACYISPDSKIGQGISIPHPSGIVIGNGVLIGENCTIYQQVTIGGKRIGDMSKNNYPIVGNNVTIFAGAKILGKINIGDGAVIGANSVVTKNVEPNSVYAGIPAKRIDKIGDRDE